MIKAPLLVILGPTAVGKTELSLSLAEQFNGEIISADSRLFYRGMDIGTAKPSPEEQARVPHHMIDLCAVDETLTLGEYQDRVKALIADCHQRGKLPMLVGGTGQYIKAVVEGWGIPRVGPHPELRAVLGKMPVAELARWLDELDPAAGQRVDKQNPRRVIRALEVILVSGRLLSELQAKTPPDWSIFKLGLFRDREALYQRIDDRVDLMLENGLEQEVRRLHEAGYGWNLPAMSGLGYRQFAPYFAGESTLAEAVERIKFETHRFVRHQNNWFQPSDETINWTDAAADDLLATAQATVSNWLYSAKTDA